LPINQGIVNWTALLDMIDTAGKYVALNFSAGAVPGRGTEFDPGTANTGEKYVARLVLPDAAESIADGFYMDPLFQYFTALKEVSGRNIKTIRYGAFYGCAGLTSVSFPAATSIGGGAFEGCTSLTVVNLPASLTSIEGNPFPNCRNLTTITVAPGNTHYKAQDGMLLTIGGTLIAYPSASGTIILSGITSIGEGAFWSCTDLTSASFPVATSIGEGAFQGCTGLTSVSFPVATSIGAYAFVYCTGLTAVNLPASLTSIEGNPFVGCVNLTTITVAPGNTHYKVQDGMLLTIDGTQLIIYPGASGTVTLPGITSIGEGAFAGCTGLISVSFPVATSIGADAFEGCTGLTTASLPAATSIGWGAFRYTGGTALTITLGSAPPSVDPEVFFGVDVSKTVTVRVPSGAVTAYNTAWQTAFKGAGADGWWEVNTFINLIIQGY
jgi:hypothetical protein